MGMQPILSDDDYHNTTRAYFFCIIGLVIVDGVVRWPEVLIGLAGKGIAKLGLHSHEVLADLFTQGVHISSDGHLITGDSMYSVISS